MRIYIYLIIFSSILLSCNNSEKKNVKEDLLVAIPFDSQKWKAKSGSDYPFRETMMDSVLYSKELRSIKKDSIFALLGPPDKMENDHLYYTVSQKRIQSFPLHTRTIVIKLKSDHTVEWIKLHE